MNAPIRHASFDRRDRAFPHVFLSKSLSRSTESLEWLDAYLPEIRAALLTSGAVLLRGFDLTDPARFAEVATRIGGPLGDRYEGPSPRKGVGLGVYTASEVSSAVAIPEHSEMSYLESSPRHLFFLCREPSRTGGETTIVDGRRVLARLDPEVIGPLVRAPVRIRRRHAKPEGLHDPFELNRWSTMFGTRDAEDALASARSLGFDARIEASGAMTLEHAQPMIRTHPETRESAWLNHLLVFHSSTPTAVLWSGARRALGLRSAALFPLAAAYRTLTPWIGREVATDVRLGDGTPIPEAAVAHVREVVERESVPVEWQRGDLLVLDNHLVLHGRRPFRGRRDVVVAWSEARA